jgi:hypothetical protein
MIQGRYTETVGWLADCTAQIAGHKALVKTLSEPFSQFMNTPTKELSKKETGLRSNIFNWYIKLAN